MKKTKAKVKEHIRKRCQLLKKELLLEEAHESDLEYYTFFDDMACSRPVEVMRLKEPTFKKISELSDEEISELQKLKDEPIPQGYPAIFGWLEGRQGGWVRTELYAEGKSGFVMVNNGFLDGEGYLHIRINPDATRELIHYFIDETLDTFPGFPHLKKDPKKKNRFRDEKIQALVVWEQRRLRKSFPEIARGLKIKEDTARKMFYSVHKMKYGRKYDPAEYEKPEIKKEYLKRTCETCNNQPTCTDLCPDVIEFLEQGTSNSLSKSPTDDYCDANASTTNYVEDAMIEYLDSIAHAVKK